MALREIFAKFGFDFDKSKLKEINSAVDGVKKHAKEAGGREGFGALAEGVKAAFAGILASESVRFVNDIAEQAAQLKDASEQTGLATDELQAYSLAAEQAGASQSDFTAGLKRLSKELATGTDELGGKSKLFDKLKIQTKDASGQVRKFSDVLPEIADKIAGLQSPAEQTALAVQLFGRGGAKLLPILKQGAAGVKQLKQNLADLGGGFSQEAIDKADEYDDSVVRLEYSFRSFKSLIGVSVFPLLEKIVGILTRGTAWLTNFAKETTGVQTAIGGLAVALGVTLWTALAPFLLPGLAFAGIFLAVDDLVAFLQGKDSVIGRILDGWFGDGTADTVRAWCKDAGSAVLGLIEGPLDLLRLAFAKDANESDEIGSHFLRVTKSIGDAVDWVLDKLKTLKDAFTDLDTLQEGANSFLDAVTSPFDTPEDVARKNERRTKRAAAAAGPAVNVNGFTAGAGGASAANPNAAALFDALATNVGRAPLRPEAAPAGGTVNNTTIAPQVNQTFAPGTGPEVRKIAQDAAKQGVLAGLADYRSAMQSLEQRGGVPFK